MGRRLAFERLCDQVAARCGFRRISTPTFERLELFTAKSGDAIVDQLYSFKDRSDRDLTLRPELTAPVMRMVAEQGGQMAKPARWCYYGPCFRYEESKAGRYREFWQYGCEIIGASGPLTEAEVVGFACSILDAAGLEDWQLRIGNVGVLNDVLSGLGLEGESVGDAMRLLDKGNFDGLVGLGQGAGIGNESIGLLRSLAGLEGGVETLPRARDILTGMDITTTSLDDLEQMLGALASLAPAPPSLTVDFTVARGLDYYTGMVFEIDVAELGGEGQVCGGGSYNLLHLFDLADLDPCCGFGLGFDRVLIALERQAERLGRAEVVPGENSGPGTLALIPFKVDADIVLPLVGELRAAGEQVLLELRQRNLGRSMSWADASGAEFALIVGPRDIEAGEATIKRLSDGEQRTTTLDSSAVISTLGELRD